MVEPDAGCSAEIVDSVEDAFYFIHVHKPKDELKIESPLYIVSLDRSSGTRLGLKLDVQAVTRSLYIKEIVSGLASQYNTKADGPQKVKPGDRVVRVNHIENDAEQMLEECKKKQVLELEIHRGSAVPIMAGLAATVKCSFGPCQEGEEGYVTKVDAEGDCLINLHGEVLQWVCKEDYDKMMFEDADRYYFKRFEDFKELHLNLKQKIDSGAASPIRCLPPLPPEESSFGFRRHLFAVTGMGAFTENRKIGLQTCLNKLLSQVDTLDDEPLLAEFFGASALPKVDDKKEELLLERLGVLALKHLEQSAV